MVKTVKTAKTPSKTPTRGERPSSIAKFQSAARRALSINRRESCGNGFGIGERFDLPARNSQKSNLASVYAENYIPRKPRVDREISPKNKSNSSPVIGIPAEVPVISPKISKIPKTPKTPKSFYAFAKKLSEENETMSMKDAPPSIPLTENSSILTHDNKNVVLISNLTSAVPLEHVQVDKSINKKEYSLDVMDTLIPKPTTTATNEDKNSTTRILNRRNTTSNTVIPNSKPKEENIPKRASLSSIHSQSTSEFSAISSIEPIPIIPVIKNHVPAMMQGATSSSTGRYQHKNRLEEDNIQTHLLHDNKEREEQNRKRKLFIYSMFTVVLISFVCKALGFNFPF